MRFGDISWLYLLWLPLALVFLYMWGAARKRRLMHKFLSPEILPRLLDAAVWKKQNYKAALMTLAAGFMLVALARPQWGFKWEDVRQEGADIVIVLDVSNSMLAADIPPNRLTRAKHKVADLLNMLDGDRAGLVAFAGVAYLQCPLTVDYAAATIFLDAIDTDLIPIQGTDIGAAIRAALGAFNATDRKAKAIILITDGEDQEGGALAAARMAKEQGVKIFAVGIGQETGAPIPDPQGGFKKDAQGDVVLSKLGEKSLQQIALDTGGAYVRSVTGDMDLDKIYREDIKQKVEKKELNASRLQQWQERFQWFLLAALICLGLEFAVRA